MKFHKIWVIGVVGFSALASCSEKAEQVADEETAQQIEDAAVAGRQAAKPFVIKETEDTLKLQEMLLEARSQSSEYEIAGKPRQKAAFDSAFISTIRTVRPELAKAIEARPIE